jgi:hypothetical protein
MTGRLDVNATLRELMDVTQVALSTDIGASM